jgi:hypothetical protein
MGRYAAEVGKQDGPIEAELIDLLQQSADSLGRDRHFAQPDLANFLLPPDTSRQAGLGKVLRLSEHYEASALGTQPPIDMRRLDRSRKVPPHLFPTERFLKVRQKETRLSPLRE